MAEPIIEAITKIANSDKMIKLVEPDVRWHKKFTNSEVTRVLKSYLMIMDEVEKNGTKTS